MHQASALSSKNCHDMSEISGVYSEAFNVRPRNVLCLHRNASETKFSQCETKMHHLNSSN